MRYITSLSLIFLLALKISYGQKTTPNYIILDFTVGVDAKVVTSINTAIAKMTQDNDVFDIIDSRLNEHAYHNITLYINKKIDAHREEHIKYLIGEPQKAIRNIIGLHATKGGGDRQRISERELRAFFADSILIFDTLRIPLLREMSQQKRHYYLRMEGGNNKGKIYELPRSGDDLLLPYYPEIGQGTVVSLIAGTKNNEPSATFKLSFLTGDQKERLLSWKDLIVKINNNVIDNEEMATCLAGYCRAAWGNVDIRNIADQLNKMR